MKDRAVKIYSWLYYYGSLFRAIQYAQYLCAYEDIVTLDEIRQRYVDINGTDEGFDNYVADGFYDGNVKEYRPV